MRKTVSIAIAVIVIALIGLLSSAYTVSETEQVIITEFGEPVGDVVADAGLHFRTPVIQKVNRFEKRVLPFDGEPEQIPTEDKKYIYIDTFGRWRITDPLQFFKAVHDEIGAQARLDDIIDAATRDAISANPLIEAVRNSDRELTFESREEEEEVPEVALPAPGAIVPPVAVPDADVFAVDRQAAIDKGRTRITREILENAKAKVGEYGIELLDVRIKRINYVEEVRERVYTRMISEREQIAQKYRSEGEQFHLGFTGKIGREKDRLLSEAYARAEAIKAEGDAEAARIYAEAYSADPEFYLFWRTLQLYSEHLGENTTLVIGTDSDMFRYLSRAGLLEPGEAR